jgi:hypothetical protein
MHFYICPYVGNTYVDRIYPIEPDINHTTDTDRSTSYLDLRLEIDSEGWLRTKLYDKRDDFNSPIVAQWDKCDQHNYLVKGHHLHSGT